MQWKLLVELKNTGVQLNMQEKRLEHMIGKSILQIMVMLNDSKKHFVI
jgi:hypothetical protein